MSFHSYTVISCDALGCLALILPIRAVPAVVEQTAIDSGWYVDRATGRHFCPNHRPDGAPATDNAALSS